MLLKCCVPNCNRNYASSNDKKNIPRTTKRSLSSAHKHAEDEMKIFLEQDKLNFG